MKIELHDMAEVREFAALVADAMRYREDCGDALPGPFVAQRRAPYARGPEPASTAAEVKPDNPPAVPGAAPKSEQPDTPDGLPDVVDADGLPHDDRVHSTPPKTNADGRWRARRGVSAETVADVQAELRAAIAQAGPGGELTDKQNGAEEPAATETHPLPGAGGDDAPDAEALPDLPAIDYSDLADKAALIAGDQKDGQLDLLNAAKEFVAQHSTAAWSAFSEALVPGKTIMAFTPAERRLVLAAIAVYAAETSE